MTCPVVTILTCPVISIINGVITYTNITSHMLIGKKQANAMIFKSIEVAGFIDFLINSHFHLLP